MRKTINDYRNCLAKGLNNDTLSLLGAVTYAVEKFGANYGTHKAIYFDKETRSKNFNWNHTINAIEVYNNKKVILSVYWQGDSTDGSKSICLTDAIKGTRIPAEYDNIGNRAVCRHSAIDVTREDADNAIKALGEYISLDAIKAREKAKIKAEREKEMEMRVNGLCFGNKAHNKWGSDERYSNGKRAVNAVVKRDFDKLFSLKDEELKAILDKVYWQNHKSDNALGGWGKVYNLNY